MSKRDQPRKATRRRFLGQLAAGAALPIVTLPEAPSRSADPERERLRKLAAEWGSEFGDLRRIGSESEV
jgi:hypothetical protein